MRMFMEYYNNSVSKFYGTGKPTLLFLSKLFVKLFHKQLGVLIKFRWLRTYLATTGLRLH